VRPPVAVAAARLPGDFDMKPDEEIAALLFLFLSIRLRSGGVSREFPVDSVTQPVYLSHTVVRGQC
jgi:hypothetical protein